MEKKKKRLEVLISKKNMKNKIILKSFSNKIFSYMRKSEIFVLSSLWEEVGFVIVESALNNCYVISSDCPNGPTEFLNNGENGILFSSNKDGALFESFKKYLNLGEKKNLMTGLVLRKTLRNILCFTTI